MEKNYQKIMLTVSVMIASMMQALDTTIANVALPHIQGSLSASIDQINWVLTSYITASAIMTLPTGWLSSKLGSKKIFLIAVAGFTFSSILCGLSMTIEEIVLFRIFQGIFGASLIPLSQAILLDINPPEKHGSAMALWGVGVMVGPIIGPSLGGYLTDNYSWRWVFYINLPFGILSFLGMLSFGRESIKQSKPFDGTGFALFAIFIASLQLFLDRGNQLDWFDDIEIKFYFILCLSSVWMFLMHIYWAKNPFISLALFKDRNLVVSLFLIFIVGIILLATMSLLPPFLQGLVNYPVTTVGMVLVPRGLGTMLAMFFVGKLLGKNIDPRLLMFLGLVFTSFSLYEMTLFNTNVTQSMIIKTGFVQGLGLGFIFVPLSTVAFSTISSAYRVEATGLYNLLRNIGSSVGISIVFTFLAKNMQVNHSILAEHITYYNFFWLADDLSQIIPIADYTKTAALLNGQILHQAGLISYLNAFTLMMFVVFSAIPLLFLLKRKPPSAASKAHDDHPIVME